MWELTASLGHCPLGCSPSAVQPEIKCFLLTRVYSFSVCMLWNMAPCVLSAELFASCPCRASSTCLRQPSSVGSSKSSDFPCPPPPYFVRFAHLPGAAGVGMLSPGAKPCPCPRSHSTKQLLFQVLKTLFHDGCAGLGESGAGVSMLYLLNFTPN